MDANLRKSLEGKWKYHKGRATKMLTEAHELIATTPPTPASSKQARKLMDDVSKKRDILMQLDQQLLVQLAEEEIDQFCVEAGTLIDDLDSALYDLNDVVSKPVSPSSVSDDNTDQQPTTTHEHPPPQLLPSQLSDPTPPTMAAHTTLEPRQHRFNLPKLQLPTFNGDTLQWLAFHDQFTAAIDSDPTLAPVVKLQYLTSQLSGEASQLIRGLPLTNAAYNEAWQLLRNRYGRNELLINTYTKAILDLKPPTTEVNSLKNFHDKLETLMRGLHTLGTSDNTNNTMLVSIIMQKLPLQVKTQMYRELNTSDMSIKQLMAALLKEIYAKSGGDLTTNNILDEYIPASAAFFVNTKQRPIQNKQQPKAIKCAYCTQAHASRLCPIVTDIDKRVQILKRDNRCFNCLGVQHNAKKCNSRYTCFHCKARHHSSICRRESTTTSAKPTNKPPTDAHVTLAPTSTPVLLKTAVTRVQHGNEQTTVNILLDEGSQRSFVTEETVRRLKINPESCPVETLNISAFGDAQYKQQKHRSVLLNLLTRQGVMSLSALIVSKISAPIKNYAIAAHNHHDYLRCLPIACQSADSSFEIDVLIGADFYWSLVNNTVIRGPGPTAVDSKLGFLLSGPANIPPQSNESMTLVSSCFKVFADPHADIQNLASAYWELETIGVRDNPTEEKFNVQAYCSEKITHDPDGKYTARLPWTEEHEPLPPNLAVAKARTRSMVRRLDQATLQLYDTIIKDQLERQFIERVESDNQDEGHYIPHHPVYKESATTPLRIVFDCSCSQKGNPSLNDCLETGTPMLNDLVSILVRFRSQKTAFCSDIEKAFLNVRLHEDDRPYTKFLWLREPSNPESDFSTYRFRSVLFGSRSSPFILNAVLKKHLQAFPSDVANDINNNIYVDNLVSGVTPQSTDTTSQLAATYFTESNAIMQKAGFTLRAWSTNDPILRRTIAINGMGANEPTVNVLGMKWATTTDSLTYPPQLPQPQTTVTKRGILRLTSSLFDPLGLLSPVHIKARIMLQQLWLNKSDWDDPVGSTLTEQWNSLFNELSLARDMRVTRHYFDAPHNSPVELHVFCDASDKAYGAAAYLKYHSNVSLVIAKSRVAPVKAITLPRLELMAALIGVRLAKFSSNALRESPLRLVKTILWTDSQIALHWTLCSKKLPIFISNRVKEIQQANLQGFKYCPGNENPADLLTRGISAHQLKQSNLWWYGPTWLSQGDNPTESIATNSAVLCVSNECAALNNEPLSGVSLTVHSTTVTPYHSPPKTNEVKHDDPYLGVQHVVDSLRFSSLEKLLRVTAWIIRFISRNRKEMPSVISTEELRKAERLWTSHIQRQYFPRELLGQATTLARQLRLFVDEDGILRARHRMDNAALSYPTKYPILLPTNDHFTTLLIMKAHSSTLHAGTSITLATLQVTHWIPKLRQRVKAVLRKCVTCLRVTGKPYATPAHPPLPAFRVQPSVPFSVTGLDFTGTLHYVTPDKKFRKCYVCLFTCAVTRAMHLELVAGLTTEEFLQAFRRFVGRRSMPNHLISDNAQTFLAANDLLTTLLRSDSVQQHFATHRIKWSFIAKRAPWFGGFYERLIGMTKSVLRKILGRSTITYDELQTVLVETEAVLNSRPLTYLSCSHDDLAPLTPAHLLHGRPIISLPNAVIDDDQDDDPDYTVSATGARKRLAYITLLFKQIWSRWESEYLPLLRERHSQCGVRGTTQENHIKVGDVVLVHSDTKMRAHWPLAKVTGLHYSDDGFVRSARIKIKSGVTNRPIAKLYPLELSTEDELGYVEEEDASNEGDVEGESAEQQRRTEDTAGRPVRIAATNALRKIKEQVMNL